MDIKKGGERLFGLNHLELAAVKMSRWETRWPSACQSSIICAAMVHLIVVLGIAPGRSAAVQSRPDLPVDTHVYPSSTLSSPPSNQSHLSYNKETVDRLPFMHFRSRSILF